MKPFYLFDEVGELIYKFATSEALAKAIGSNSQSVRSAAKLKRVLLLRYYVGRNRKLGPIPYDRFTHNAILNIDAGMQAARGVAKAYKHRIVTVEENRGLALLAGGLCFDEYLYGQLGPKVEQPLSLFPSPADLRGAF
jgi:hypothetical protein